jgi:hypothetical protein
MQQFNECKVEVRILVTKNNSYKKCDNPKKEEKYNGYK